MEKNAYFEDIVLRVEKQQAQMNEYFRKADEYSLHHSREETEEWCDKNMPEDIVTQAEIDAYNIYEENMRLKNEEIVIAGKLHSGQIPNLMDVFKKAGVKAFVFCRPDIDAFDILDDICAEGYRLDRVVQVHGERFCLVETSGIRLVLE